MDWYLITAHFGHCATQTFPFCHSNISARDGRGVGGGAGGGFGGKFRESTLYKCGMKSTYVHRDPSWSLQGIFLDMLLCFALRPLPATV